MIYVHQRSFLTLSISLWVLCGSVPHFLTLESRVQSQPEFGKLLVIKAENETEDQSWSKCNLSVGWEGEG